jgi:hypothetical protein
MNKTDARRELLNGKRIAHNQWGCAEYIFLDEEGDLTDGSGHYYEFNEMPPFGWSVYDEPVFEKVVLYKYSFKDKNIWKESVGFFGTDDEVIGFYNTDTIIKRLDYTATEFEIEVK